MASKLEMYVDIMNALSQSGPLKASQISNEVKVNYTALETCLGFLIAQGLIEERPDGKCSVVYANTARGTAVIKFFKELDKALTAEEDTEMLPLSY